MLTRRVLRNSLLILLCSCPMPGFGATIVHEIVPLQERLRLLQTGGYVLVMRHGATDHTQKDLDRSLQPDCSRQRNLSAQGRRQMRAVGQSMQALQIPIDKVYSSPYCRTRHSAQEAFGDYQIDPDLQFSLSKDSAEAQRLADHLYQIIVNIEPGPTNNVMITHTSNIRDALGIWPKPEGTALVIERTPSALIYKGMIKPSEWPTSN